MSKGKHGNKEAKKPKQAPVAPTSPVPVAPSTGAQAVASLRKKKW